MTKESNIEYYLKECVHERKGELRKVQWISHRGAPDRLVLIYGTHFFVELKKPGEVAEDHQIREHKKLRNFGFNVHVVNSFDGVDALLDRYCAMVTGVYE